MKSIFTKDAKKKFDRLSRIFLKNMRLSYEAGASIAGFILVQFIWIFLLNGFISWFALWFLEITEASSITVLELTKLFWVCYGIWFAVNILVRMMRIKIYNEK